MPQKTKQFSVTFAAPPEGASRREQLSWIANALAKSLCEVVGEIDPATAGAESMRINFSRGESTWTSAPRETRR